MCTYGKGFDVQMVQSKIELKKTYKGLVINYGVGMGGYKTGGGGEGSFISKVFSHPKWGGGTKRFEVVLTWILEVLTILEGGT